MASNPSKKANSGPINTQMGKPNSDMNKGAKGGGKSKKKGY